DGIRAFHVTGVQTCALPIYRDPRPARRAEERELRLQEKWHPSGGTFARKATENAAPAGAAFSVVRRLLPPQALDEGIRRRRGIRSEERRVGKECRSRRWPSQ